MTLAFVFELQGGLANRLRALWSAHAFALRYKRPVVVLWPITSELACDYKQLFKLDSPVWPITVNPARTSQHLTLRLTRLLFSTVGLGLNRPIETGEAWGRPSRYAPRWMPFQWIQTCEEFEVIRDVPLPFLPHCELRNQAASRLAKARSVGGVVVGVHIRRSDHRHAIARSNTNAFITAMRDQLNRDPATCFLLCTDDPAEVEPLRILFGDRLLWYPPDCLDRSRERSAIAALIDFLVLSGCDLLFGSYLSSFSLLAARTGGVTCTVIGNPDLSTT